MSCFIFHQWSKWEQYEQTYSYYDFKTGKTFDRYLSEHRQKRTCLICGKMQDQLV